MNVTQSPLRPFDAQHYDPTWMQVQREVRERRRVNRMLWCLAAGTVVALGLAAGSLMGWVS